MCNRIYTIVKLAAKIGKIRQITKHSHKKGYRFFALSPKIVIFALKF